VSSSGEGNRHRSHREIYAIALTAGIVAGVFCWLVGELNREVFKPRMVTTVVFGRTNVGPSTETQNVADSRNAVVAFTILGGVTGLALGFAGGLGGRSLFRGAIVGVVGLALGGLVGSLASIEILPFFYRRLVPDPSDLLTPIMIHGGIFAAIAAIGGTAFAIGMGCGRRVADAIIAACAGALLGTVSFHLLADFIFPDSRSSDPVAGTLSVRLLAKLMVTLPIALGAAWGTARGLFFGSTSSPRAESQ
jgi:hypothetical protein